MTTDAAGPQPGPAASDATAVPGAPARTTPSPPRRRRRRWPLLLLVLASVTALVVGGALTLRARSALADASASLARTEAATLAAQSRAVAATDPALALALALEAVATTTPPMAVAVGALVDARRGVAAPTWQPIGEPLRALDEGSAVTFSPDGARLVAGGRTEQGMGAVRVFETGSWRSTFRRTGQLEGVTSLAHAPDGAALAAGGADGTVRLLDPGTAAQQGAALRVADGEVHAVAIDAQGHLASATTTAVRSGEVVVLDLATRTPLGRPAPSRAPVRAVAFAPDGATLAYGRVTADGTDDRLQRWAPAEGRPFGAPRSGHFGRIEALVHSPDGEEVVSAGDDGTLRRWDAATGRPLGDPQPGHEDRIIALAQSPDGALLVSTGADSTLRFWDPTSLEPVGQPVVLRNGPAVALAFRPDGAELATLTAGGVLQRWAAGAADPLGRPLPGASMAAPLPGHDGGTFGLAWSADGALLVSSGADPDRATGTAIAWDPGTGAQRGGPTIVGPAADLALPPDGDAVATAADPATGRGTITRLPLPDLAAGDPVTAHQDRVRSLAFSPDGALLATAANSAEATAELAVWRMPGLTAAGAAATVTQGRVLDLAFSPDGATLAAAVTNPLDTGFVRLSPADRPEEVTARLEAPDLGMAALAFAPAGQVLASGGANGTIRLWDPRAGALLGRPLEGHVGPVTDLAFTRDGHLLVSTGWDATVRLWDAGTGEAAGVMRTDSPIQVVAVRDDGLIATGDTAGRVLLWDPLDLAAACALARDSVTAAELAAALPAGRSARACSPG
ncbi:MAG: WD40 repeat domain-containing protein [Candidatus Nanopelagicales bacterium]|nr:WD40 repeat domain-containing protein [Candidatus Nanopelagicales bacterium]